MEQVYIQIPEGYIIDQKESNLEEGKIVFKKNEVTPWRETNPTISGFFVSNISEVLPQRNPVLMFGYGNENIFATKKQAESMLAMAQLSQIIANDERFGGPISDKEWDNVEINKYCIVRDGNKICGALLLSSYHFLAFHTDEQFSLFLKENKDLIKQYFMLD